MTIEEIREDGSSIILSSYSKEADAATIFQAYRYSQQELHRLYLSNIVVKQVIARQPIKKEDLSARMLATTGKLWTTIYILTASAAIKIYLQMK